MDIVNADGGMADQTLRRIRERLVVIVVVIMRKRITLPDQHKQQHQRQCWSTHAALEPSLTH